MLYRGVNKANNCSWIIASNKEEALQIAVKSKFVKKKENCKLQTSDKRTNDFYAFFKNKGNDMQEVDTKKGVGCVQYNSANSTGVWKVNSWW